MLKAFIYSLLAIVGLVFAAHFALPILGALMAVGAFIWIVLIVSVIAFCAVIMGLFLVSGAWVLTLAAVAGAWVLLSIIFIPIIIPILLPLFVLILFITYARRKRKLITSD